MEPNFAPYLRFLFSLSLHVQKGKQKIEVNNLPKTTPLYRRIYLHFFVIDPTGVLQGVAREGKARAEQGKLELVLRCSVRACAHGRICNPVGGGVLEVA